MPKQATTTETTEVTEVVITAATDNKVLAAIGRITDRNRRVFDQTLTDVIAITDLVGDKLTQDAFAERYEVSQSDVSRWYAAARIMREQPEVKDWYKAEGKRMESISGFITYYNNLPADGDTPSEPSVSPFKKRPESVTNKVISEVHDIIVKKLRSAGYTDGQINRILSA